MGGSKAADEADVSREEELIMDVAEPGAPPPP